MKITRLFRPFLDSQRYLILPSIGKLEMIAGHSDYQNNETGKNILHFKEDKNIQPDPEFLTFLSRHLKVDPNILMADLQCFSDSTNELLIQGFEAEIPAIGFLHRNQKHQIQFSVKSIYSSATKINLKKHAAFLSASFWL